MEPVITPTPEPTPEPTAIMPNLFSPSKSSGFTVPAVSDIAEAAITKVFVSPANENGVVQIDGYALINQEQFDGSKLQVFLIVTQKASGKQIAYQCSMVSGISGDTHLNAICLNPADTDFEGILDVSKYADGEYGLGAVLYYQMNGKKAFAYCEFPQSISLTGGKAALSGADIGDATPFLPGEPVTPENADDFDEFNVSDDSDDFSNPESSDSIG